MVAYALLGDQVFYDARMDFDPQFTKEEIQKKISRWSQYTSEEAIIDLYGESRQGFVDKVKGFIEEYTHMMETAPVESTRNVCEWKFQKASFYSVPYDEAIQKDTSKDNDKLVADVVINGVPYRYTAVTRNQEDFKLNSISLRVTPGKSPSSLDKRIFEAMLCRTEKPTEKQVEAIKGKAEKILSEIGLGEWVIDSCNLVSTAYGAAEEYCIQISAVPAFEGTPALRQPPIQNITGTESYASNYYLSDAQFRFTGNGELLDFHLESPVEIKNTNNVGLSAMELPALMAQAKEYFTLSDRENYGMNQEMLQYAEEESGEQIFCDVKITEMQCGLVRIKAENQENSFCYVPAIILSGSIDYVGSESGNVYEASGETMFGQRTIPLLALNALDGSRIMLGG